MGVRVRGRGRGRVLTRRGLVVLEIWGRYGRDMGEICMSNFLLLIRYGSPRYFCTRAAVLPLGACSSLVMSRMPRPSADAGGLTMNTCGARGERRGA